MDGVMMAAAGEGDARRLVAGVGVNGGGDEGGRWWMRDGDGLDVRWCGCRDRGGWPGSRQKIWRRRKSLYRWCRGGADEGVVAMILMVWLMCRDGGCAAGEGDGRRRVAGVGVNVVAMKVADGGCEMVMVWRGKLIQNFAKKESMKKAFQDMLHGLGEVNLTHAYYNGSRTSKDNEDQRWNTSIETKRTQKTTLALEVLWKTLFNCICTC
nr:hypothetical protein [Tanacetum cinerariifolium]